MADRYRLQINEQHAPAAFGRAYGDNAAQIGGALAGLGKGIEGWGAWLQERQDKWDAATVMNAQTEFARRMSDYLDNPETGATVKRKFGAANGLTNDTDAYADKVAGDISSMLDNDRQRAVFNSGIAKAKMPYFKQASVHEARELEAFRKQAFDANMAAASDMYLRGADNPEIRKDAVNMAARAIRSQYVGAPEEYIQRAIDETQSSMAAQWVARVTQDNPKTALEMLSDDNLGLLPETKDKLRGQLKPKAEVYEIQEIADTLIAKYPQGTEQELYDYIRKHYEGEREEKIISAIKARVNERHIKEDAEERALAKAQRAYKDSLIAGMLNGEFPTAEQIAADVDAQKLSGADGWAITNMVGTQAMAAGTRKRLEKTIPGWASLDPTKQDEAVMRAMPGGPTDAEHKAETQRLLDMAFNGSITNEEFKAEINAAAANMRITRREKAQFLGLRGKMKDEQKEFVGRIREDLRLNLGTLFNSGTGKQAARDAAKAYFNDAISKLDPNSTTYRKDVMQAMKDALVKGVEVSGKKLMDTHWFREDTPSKFGERYNALSGAIDERIAGVEEYTPRFTLDDLDLPETRQTPAPAPKAGGKGSKQERANYEKYKPTIDSCAQTYGVEPELVRAIIQVESGWKPGIVSKAGAQGLMQLMPGTAAGLGVTDAFDPEQNIKGGTKYIASLVKRYDGDVEKAVAAYNCGPGRVDKGGKLPKETQKYVPNVMALYRKYKGEAAQAAPVTEPVSGDVRPQEPVTPTPLPERALVSGDMRPPIETFFGGNFNIGG